jgi:hypothetical protein
MGAIDAERLVGGLLRATLGGAGPEQPHAERPAGSRPAEPSGRDPQEAPPQPAREREPSERSTRSDHRPRGHGERERPPRERGSRDRERPGRGERDRRDRGPRRQDGPAARATADDSRDFWEVWSEEVGRTGPTAPPAGNATPAEGTAIPAEGTAIPAEGSTETTGRAAPGLVRLYVNLGRKDNVTPELVAELLTASGATVPASDVELMNTHSYINVTQETAGILCAAMNGRTHNGRAVVCEPARPPRRRY